jgi:periplasmic divalent cation tolerance protein
MILVYVTCKDKKEAKHISKKLLEKKLIACANIFPIESIYCWKKKTCQEKETVLLLKTTSKNFKETEKQIKKIHSYEIPCILKLNVQANKEFDRWVEEQTK